MIEVVDPDRPERVVGYGETGRVRLTTLTKEFFMPRFLSGMRRSGSSRARRILGMAFGMSGRFRRR